MVQFSLGFVFIIKFSPNLYFVYQIVAEAFYILLPNCRKLPFFLPNCLFSPFLGLGLHLIYFFCPQYESAYNSPSLLTLMPTIHSMLFTLSEPILSVRYKRNNKVYKCA